MLNRSLFMTKIAGNPYSKKSITGEYNVYFNLFYNYYEKFETQPNIYEFSLPIAKITFENLEKLKAQKIYFYDFENVKDKKKTIEDAESCYEYNDALIFFYKREGLINRIDIDYLDDNEIRDQDFSVYKCKILYQKKETLEKIKSKIKFEEEKKETGNVYLLCSVEGMLGLQKFDIKLPQKEIDLELNYGSKSIEKINKIISSLSSKNKSGLMLFSGDPGTGKSTFIKYLTTKTKRKVIYLSSGVMDQLTNPDFITFMMRHRNSILLLEDAEKVIRSRDSNNNDAISNLLNVTDGILGDCLNIMVIATFNIDREKIDSALVRKGRLIIEHHFEALSPEECNKIFKLIKSKRKTDKPLTLAEIYNEEENYHSVEDKRKIGF